MVTWLVSGSDTQERKTPKKNSRLFVFCLQQGREVPDREG